jgi:signal transduction histidine kinase
MPHEITDHPHARDLLRQIDELQQGIDQLGSQETAVTRLATIGSLACMMAHEMNNLLTPALNYAKMALDAPADTRINRKAHESAITSVQACQRMASSLLGFATTEPQQGGAASVSECVSRAIACLPRELSKDGIRVERNVPTPLLVCIDETALDQVLLNLILNARQAMSRGGTLTIRAERSTWNSGEPGAVSITVADTGEGIPPEQVERIFQPFVSLRSGEQSPGSGLGLAICRQLLESAGGTIRVESEPGRGSSFVLSLSEASRASCAA